MTVQHQLLCCEVGMGSFVAILLGCWRGCYGVEFWWFEIGFQSHSSSLWGVVLVCFGGFSHQLFSIGCVFGWCNAYMRHLCILLSPSLCVLREFRINNICRLKINKLAQWKLQISHTFYWKWKLAYYSYKPFRIVLCLVNGASKLKTEIHIYFQMREMKLYTRVKCKWIISLK